tara:strand:- start:422 stop:628 length:207 start_codon:yes stop_codon:yes gene_type:complete
MLEVIIISIGLVLVVEGAIYFLFADKLDYLVSFLKSVDTKKIKKVSLIIIFIGFCLIYFTFRNYNEIN